MDSANIHLDRVRLDGVPFRRRSATLRIGPGEAPGTEHAAWWLFLAGETLHDAPPRQGDTVLLTAHALDGRAVRGTGTVVSRRDTAWGTELILAGEIPAALGSP